MAEKAAVQVDCPRCDTRIESGGYVFVDADTDTAQVAQMANDAINLIKCDNCGFTGRLPLPLVYHDAALEVVAAYVPDYQTRPAEEVREALLPIVAWVVEQTPPEEQKPYLFQVQAVDDFAVMQALAQRSLDARAATADPLPGLPADGPITPQEQALLDADEETPGDMTPQDLVEAQFALLRQMIAAPTPDERAALLDDNRAIADARLVDILGILADQAAQARDIAAATPTTPSGDPDPTAATNREAAARAIAHLDTIKAEIGKWLKEQEG